MFKTLSRLIAVAGMSALALFGCKSTENVEEDSLEQSDEAWILYLDIGRQGVLLERAEALLGESYQSSWRIINANEDSDSQSDAALYRSLYAVTLGYDELQENGCASGQIPASFCKSSYAPVWLVHPNSATYKLTEIRGYFDELQSAVSPLQGHFCSKGVERSGDDMYCSVE